MSHGATLGRDFKHARRGAPGGVLAFSGRTGLVVGLLAGVAIGFGLAAVTLRGEDGVGATVQRPAQSASETSDATVIDGRETGPAIPQGPAPTMMLPPEPSDESSVIDTSPP